LATPAGCLEREHELSGAAWIGALDVAARHFADALPLLDRALAHAPDDTAVLANRALALEGVGRASDAEVMWARIAALAPATALGRKSAERASAKR
jgi:Flp pilus assembly protein TadD